VAFTHAHTQIYVWRGGMIQPLLKWGSLLSQYLFRIFKLVVILQTSSSFKFTIILFFIQEKTEILEQVNQFTYLGCSISYQCSNDVEFKLAKFLQLIGAIKRTIFKKVRTETVLKLYNTLILQS
jgi:hypothetical protein